MSIEGPEAMILAEQIQKEFVGKKVKSCHLQEYDRMQRIGFLNKNIEDFEQLVGGVIKAVRSRGNTIHVKFDNQTNLILTPEYGGHVFYARNEKTVSEFHLKICFDDDSALAVRLTSMGLIQAFKDEDLERSYTYRRDFNMQALSPFEDFRFESFSELLKRKNIMLKSVLVGKDAIIVGVSNSAYQDIIYRAGLHPKKKSAELNEVETRRLFGAISLVIQERIRLNGKDQFYDLYGKQGKYTPTMGSNMKGRICPRCRRSIERLNIGGGQTYFCPKCQTQ